MRLIEAREVMLQYVREMMPSIERDRVASDVVDRIDNVRSAGPMREAASVQAPTRHRRIGCMMLVYNAYYGECTSECRARVTRWEVLISVYPEPVRTEMRAHLLKGFKHVKRVPDVCSGDCGESTVKEAVWHQGVRGRSAYSE
jgi:hypothetical protein